MSDKNCKTPAELSVNDFLVVPCISAAYLSRDECARVRGLMVSDNFEGAAIGHDKNRQLKQEVRKTEVTWLKSNAESQWLFNKVLQTMVQVNRNYNFDISGIEDMQVARYVDGGFYDWHMDVGRGKSSNRKLSLTVQLSEMDDYEGGELQFFNKDIQKVSQPLKDIGSATIFPSYLTHRVTPVTSGERWSLVAWIQGTPFR